MTGCRRGTEHLVEEVGGEKKEHLYRYVDPKVVSCFDCVSFFFFFLHPLSTLPAQTDRSCDTSGLRATRGCSTVCCVSALTGLIRSAAQTQQGRGGLMLLLADKTRRTLPSPSLPLVISSFVCSLGQPSQLISTAAV